MNSETLKQLGEPSNDMEREIFEYLTACSDPELDTRILEKKLSLEGCLEFCFKKGNAAALLSAAFSAAEQSVLVRVVTLHRRVVLRMYRRKGLHKFRSVNPVHSRQTDCRTSALPGLESECCLNTAPRLL